MNSDFLKYIYLDESGNLGFSDASGEYFVVEALCCEEEKSANRCIKKHGLNYLKNIKILR